MQFSHGFTVVRVRAGGIDRWGDRLPETLEELPGCAIAPLTSDEDSNQRASVTTGFAITVPAGADVKHTDEFLLPPPFSDGEEHWQVVGELAPWLNPFTGWSPGSIINVKRRSG